MRNKNPGTLVKPNGNVHDDLLGYLSLSAKSLEILKEFEFALSTDFPAIKNGT